MSKNEMDSVDGGIKGNNIRNFLILNLKDILKILMLYLKMIWRKNIID